MTRRIAPAPTREEVLAVFRDDDRVFSAGEVADRIFRQRGGVGQPNEIPVLGRDYMKVLPVGVGRVKNVLVEMVEDGTLMSEVGEAAGHMGSVWSVVRPNGTYFALRSTAEAALAEHKAITQKQQDAQRCADEVAAMLGDRADTVKAHDDRVHVILTIEQAEELFDLARFRKENDGLSRKEN